MMNRILIKSLLFVSAAGFSLLAANSVLLFWAFQEIGKGGVVIEKIYEDIVVQSAVSEQRFSIVMERFAVIMLGLEENRGLINDKTLSDKKVIAENEVQVRAAQRKLDLTGSQLADITSSISEVSLMLDRGVDDQILDILIERAIEDYTQKGITLFDEALYEKAYSAFTNALKYGGEDAEIRFYQLYSLYLMGMNGTLDRESYWMIYKGLVELSEFEYISTEGFVFSEQEIRQKLNDMKYNIEEKARQEGEVF
jgi:hypothetical protein